MYASGTMIMFGAMFREIAEQETRVITYIKHPELGSESYALVDVYCIDPTCDCRRVILNVIRDSDSQPIATVNWGWDPKDEMPGPFLDPMNRQSRISDVLLDLVADLIRTDRPWVERLKRHYRIVKEAIADPAHEVHQTLERFRGKGEAPPSSRPSPIAPGRNSPCPSGSGKKHKKCCGA